MSLGIRGKLAWIRVIAREDRKLNFDNLLHHISKPLLYKAYQCLNRKAVAGIDGEIWKNYGEKLGDNIVKLHLNVQSGRYKANAVLRKWIDKPDGTKRPLGI